MIDLIDTIRGGSHCPWCQVQDTTAWDKLMRFDQAINYTDRKWYERLACRLSQFNDWTRMWMLGERWHKRHHETKYDAVAEG